MNRRFIHSMENMRKDSYFTRFLSNAIFFAENMDFKDTVQMFCNTGKAVTKDMVSVEWDKKYNMKHHSSLHPLIEELWLKKSENSIRLFNASKFRYHQVVVNKRENILSSVKFLLGTTNYKEFIGTNCAPFAEKLVAAGISDYSDPQAYLSNPVRVGGLLETNEKDLVFIRRSNTCAEMPGLIDRPGGHPEPDEVSLDSGDNGSIFNSHKVVDEIFDSVLKEIRDEVNIPIEKLSSPLLLGISYNPSTWRRPSFEFYVRCYLSTQEVISLYSKQTQAESDESTDLIIIPVSKVLDYDNFRRWDLYNELTHAAQSAILCLQTYFVK